ncbi:MAG: patatin-like phospholipase family protein [Atribacterota bacterium]|nr:patatin-like phospholipase family protein [Atribacterota bacterium]
MKKIIKLIRIVIVFVLLFSTVSSFSYASPKIGLALGEGGERFYIHIGVLKALRDEGIKVDCIAGTSIGALIGGLYALWEDVEKMEEYILNLDFNKYYMSEREDIKLQNMDETLFIVFYSNISKDKIGTGLLRGLMDGKIMRDEIDRLTNWASFEYDLKIPFKAVATDLISGEKVLIDQGKISNAIAASMSVPGLFVPFELEGKILVDGGLKDPVPADVVREMGADIVIGVNLRDIQEDTLPVFNNVVSILLRSVYIMLGELDEISANKADIVINPHYRGPLSTDMEKEKKIRLIKLGEEETKKIIPLLKTLINSY